MLTRPTLTRRSLARGALGLGAASLAPSFAQAQGNWPDRPLRLIIGYPPGGASDLFGRMIAGQMGPRLGHNVVVENRPGGGAVVASEAVARSAPDGNTLLHVDNGILVYNPALYARLPYDPDKDLAGVGFIGRFPLFLVVKADSPIQDLAGYIAASKAKAPTYGTPAVASPHHLAMEMFKRRAGFDATHVPYRGGPAAMQDLLAGTVDSVVIDCATGTAFIADGRVRALCVLSEARSPTSAAVPTARELGFANAIAYGWQGICVPIGTPAPVVSRLSAELARAIGSDEVQARFTTLGIERANFSPADFAAFVARENAEWRPLIRELGIRLDS
ncbi:tripartite tricarboxylate transporter substrate binding protein [Roseomonas sp. KE2513]|uniref:Bug family tripartite tricarboxylate transporter substrate binding protein n=1 Tax=Roseomonas sp. KE2513 TaxID=2479202 RepID=UPI0018DF4E49|nr:tripartite tricarboxylate transporter substrate binding protein [Roseomonas sp. KE2513]MBI0535724.1 tripartite tricarboxylate transporter substrate binding protein [Roseomonas sp. KE2513]